MIDRSEELELGRKLYARTNGLDTLDRVQRESGQWRANAYPDSVNDTLAGLAGVTEEIGELAHAVLKHHQGIRGYDLVRTRTEAGDAIADAIIYMCHVADTLGLNVADELSKAWAHVKSRNIVQNSDPGKPPHGMVLDTMSARQIGDLTEEEQRIATLTVGRVTKPGGVPYRAAVDYGKRSQAQLADEMNVSRIHVNPVDLPRGSGFLGMPQPGDEVTILAHGHDEVVRVDYGTNFGLPVVVPVFTKCPGKPHDGHFAVDQLCPLNEVEDDNAFAGEITPNTNNGPDEARSYGDCDTSDERWSLQEAGDE